MLKLSKSSEATLSGFRVELLPFRLTQSKLLREILLKQNLRSGTEPPNLAKQRTPEKGSSLFGGSSGARTHDTLLKRQVL